MQKVSNTKDKLPLALVEWDDAWGDNEGPVSLDDVHLSHKPEPITTLGWVLKYDEVGISLANEHYLDKYRGRTFIPRGMVRSVTYYKLTTQQPPKKVQPDVPSPLPPDKP